VNFAHNITHGLSLRVQFLAGRGAFLSAGGCLLGYLLHLGHGFRDLFDTVRLVLAAQLDFIHQDPDLDGALGNAMDRFSNLLEACLPQIGGRYGAIGM
jgi:hypothetical protein